MVSSFIVEGGGSVQVRVKLMFPLTVASGTTPSMVMLTWFGAGTAGSPAYRSGPRAAGKKNLTPFDVLTIASMVEREVQVPSERPVVAGVIYNRLHRRMRLDIDATVQYAVGAWRDLTAKDLLVDSPYNTRRFPGLPPGPIASPGLASIEAAAHPKASDYLYYVARNDGSGRHYFATSEAEFQRLQAKAQANGGIGFRVTEGPL